jgi:tetratricopeptide (TPR) repeat protein
MGAKKYIFLIVISFCLILFASACSDKGSKQPTAKEYFNKAYQFVDAGNLQEAIFLYNLSIEKDPQFTDAYYNRGVIYYFLKDYKNAISDFDKTIRLNPAYAMAYASRGQVYEGIKDNNQAITDYKVAAKLGDNDAKNYLKSKNIDWQDRQTSQKN